MDFGALPPEINSARIHADPSSGPLLVAAGAWDALAAELWNAATRYQAATAELASGPWPGPGAASMAAATEPYVVWLHTTGTAAAQAAAQARAAASAYEAARAMSVPQLAIDANRALLMSLVSTNILGQNVASIAATEAHYGSMWAQDAAAMYGYAVACAAASRLKPLRSPAGVARTAGAAAGSPVMSAVPDALRGLASPGPGAPPLSALASLSGHAAELSGHARTTTSALSFMTGAIVLGRSAHTAGAAGALGGAGVPAALSGVGAMGSTGPTGVGAAGGAAVSAGLTRAASVGAMSVPATWTAAAPVLNPGIATAAETMLAPAGIPVLPMGGVGARGTGRLAIASRLLLRPNMLPRRPAGG